MLACVLQLCTLLCVEQKGLCYLYEELSYCVLQDIIACVLLMMIFIIPCSSSYLWFALKEILVCAVDTYETGDGYCTVPSWF
jgi:hypothetical protein